MTEKHVISETLFSKQFRKKKHDYTFAKVCLNS